MAEQRLPIPTPNGFDSVVAVRNAEWSDFLPEGAEVTLVGERSAVIDEDTTRLTPDQLIRASIVLRLLVVQAVKMGGIPQKPRVAWFTITTDPAVVARYGSAHDCATCRAGTDLALAALRDDPGTPLVVGILAF